MEIVAMKEIYGAYVINQQVQAYVLENAIANERGYFTEAEEGFLSKLKNKVSDFIKMVRGWLAKLKKFLFETIPNFIKRKWNQLLIFLKIKKKPVPVNAEKAKDKEKIKQAVAVANKSASTYALATIKVGPTDVTASKQSSSDNSGSTNVAVVKQNAIQTVEKLMEINKSDKALYLPILDAVKNNKFVYLIGSRDNKTTTAVSMFDYKMVKDCMDGFMQIPAYIEDVLNNFADTLNQVDLSSEEKIRNVVQRLNEMKNDKSINVDNLFDELGITPLSKIKDNEKAIDADIKEADKYMALQKSTDAAAANLQKAYKTTESKTNNAIKNLESISNSRNESTLGGSLITSTMEIFRIIMSLMSGSCTKFNQYQQYIIARIADYIKECNQVE